MPTAGLLTSPENPRPSGAARLAAIQLLEDPRVSLQSLAERFCRLPGLLISDEGGGFCLIEFLRTSLGLPEGGPGIVMAIHSFGEYLDSTFTCQLRGLSLR